MNRVSCRGADCKNGTTGGEAIYAFARATKRDYSFYAGHLAVLLMQKGRIENPSFCFAGCFSGSLHYSRLPENSSLK